MVSNSTPFCVNLGDKSIADAYTKNWGDTLQAQTDGTDAPDEPISQSGPTPDQTGDLIAATQTAASQLNYENAQGASDRYNAPWHATQTEVSRRVKGAPVTKEDPQIGKVLNRQIDNDLVEGQVVANIQEGNARNVSLNKAQQRVVQQKQSLYRNYQSYNSTDQTEAQTINQEEIADDPFGDESSIFNSLRQQRATTPEPIGGKLVLFPENATQQIANDTERTTFWQSDLNRSLALATATPAPVQLDRSVQEDVMRPFWLNDMLILARRGAGGQPTFHTRRLAELGHARKRTARRDR